MAETKYTYSISSDVIASVAVADILQTEIVASPIATNISYVNTLGDILDIVFSNSITTIEKTILDEVVAKHDPSDTIAAFDESEKELYLTRHQYSGRLLCNNKHTWMSTADDLYGVNYHIWSEYAGTSVDPSPEWEHSGFIVTAGETFKNFRIIARSNSTQVIELEYAWVFRRPDNPSRWLSGIDSDREMNNTVFHRDFFVNHSSGQLMSGNTNDNRRRVDTNINYVFPEDGFATLYLRGISTSTKYMYVTCQFDIRT